MNPDSISPLAPGGEGLKIRGRATLTVVIPTLNEESALAATLQSLGEQSEPAERIVVSDAGSTDNTVSIAQSGGCVIVLSPTRGRGHQIAHGLSITDADMVLVAHADMRFPIDALRLIRSTMAKLPDCPGGCLGHRFDSSKLVYRWMEWADRRRAERGHAYGDQGQFFRPAMLEDVGGFPALAMMEDVELSDRLRQLGTPVYLNCPVVVSPRRFEKRGLLRTLWQNRRIRRAYRKHGMTACDAIYRRYYAK